MKPETKEYLNKQRDEIFEKLYEALPNEAYAGAILAALGQLCCAVIEHTPQERREQALDFFVKNLTTNVDLNKPALGEQKLCTEDDIMADIIGVTAGEA